MKDLKFGLALVASNLISLCLTGFAVVQLWTRLSQTGGFRHRSLQNQCCDCSCNGLVSNCVKRANQIMYAGLHNAMASKEDNFLFPNHLLSMEKAMDAGFRAFLLDSCDCNGASLCHGYCFAGQREPGKLLENVAQFLKNNKNEVIILEFQMLADNLSSLFQTTSQEFRDLLYKHPSTTQPWPTLKEMAAMNKRIIFFQHDGASCNVAGQCPEGVMDTFDHLFETSFELDGAEEVLDYDASCKVFRGPQDAAFMTSNHWAGGPLGLPSRDVAEIVNVASVLEERLNECEKRLGKRTNILAVDFWSIGDTVEVVKKFNAAL